MKGGILTSYSIDAPILRVDNPSHHFYTENVLEGRTEHDRALRDLLIHLSLTPPFHEQTTHHA